MRWRNLVTVDLATKSWASFSKYKAWTVYVIKNSFKVNFLKLCEVYFLFKSYIMLIWKFLLYCSQLLFVAYIFKIIKCGTHTVKKVPLATFLGIKVKMTQMEISLKTNSDLRYAVFTLQVLHSTSSH